MKALALEAIRAMLQQVRTALICWQELGAKGPNSATERPRNLNEPRHACFTSIMHFSLAAITNA
eukprot:4799160-Pleurochrysis_carterae.AAC.4